VNRVLLTVCKTHARPLFLAAVHQRQTLPFAPNYGTRSFAIATSNQGATGPHGTVVANSIAGMPWNVPVRDSSFSRSHDVPSLVRGCVGVRAARSLITTARPASFYHGRWGLRCP
jgi:hypothetical protein